jgi:hypothetical protein
MNRTHFPRGARSVGFLPVFVAAICCSAAASSITITNSSFSTPTIACGLGYAYDGSGGCTGTLITQQNFDGAPGFGWTLTAGPIFGQGGDGLTGPSTAFSPPSFSGMPFTQAVFLQGTNNGLSQVISGFSAGKNYVLNFYLGSRFASGIKDGDQTVEALLNGSVIGTWALSSFAPFTLESASFTASSGGSESLEFKGLNTGDHTAFLSDVSIHTTVPEPPSLLLMMMGCLACGGIAMLKSRCSFR